MYCLVLIGASNEVLMYKKTKMNFPFTYWECILKTSMTHMQKKRKQIFKVTKYAIQKKNNYASNALWRNVQIYYFILKENKMYASLCALYVFFLNRDVGLTMLTKLFWIYFSSIKRLCCNLFYCQLMFKGKKISHSPNLIITCLPHLISIIIF